MKAHSISSFILAMAGLIGGELSSAAEPTVEQHVLVYGEQGMFGGWPANHGMWHWGDELLVGFSIGYHKNLGPRHNIDRNKPEYHVLGRSLDGGRTWTIEKPAEKGMLINTGGMRHGITDPKHRESDPKPITEAINFSHPDFCMTLRYQNVDGGNSRLYYSYDRGHNWKGPYHVPSFGQNGVMSRTDYIVNGGRECDLFLTGSKANHEEGRVFCGRTSDGGLTWKFVAFVGPEPTGFSIMPSTVRVAANMFVMTTRRREGPEEPKRRWIDTWQTRNRGQTWTHLNDAVDDLGEGNPPSLIKLKDGRLCLTYGVRKSPFEMQAKFSSDEGVTWSNSFALHTNGGGHDMGYPRTAQRPDGKLVTLYYFQPSDSPYRQIIATIWDAG